MDAKKAYEALKGYLELTPGCGAGRIVLVDEEGFTTAVRAELKSSIRFEEEMNNFVSVLKDGLENKNVYTRSDIRQAVVEGMHKTISVAELPICAAAEVLRKYEPALLRIVNKEMADMFNFDAIREWIEELKEEAITTALIKMNDAVDALEALGVSVRIKRDGRRIVDRG